MASSSHAARALPARSAPVIASQLLLVDEVLRAGANMRRTQER
jgi:hypothetical protein